MNKNTFAKTQNYKHGGRLKIKIRILFYGDKSYTVAFRQTKFGIMKEHGHI
jgi:hypothetical protein